MTKITISKSELLSKLASASKILSGKPSLPIMDFILFQSKEGKLLLSAADASGRIDTSIENVSIEGDVDICIEAKRLLEALKTLPEQPLTFIIDETSFLTVIKYAGGKFELMGKETSQFPENKPIKDPKQISIPSDVLIAGITKTINFAANDDLRPVMNGVFTESNGNKLCFVASDGHALALFEKEFTSIPFALNIPQRIAGILTKLLPSTGEIDIKIGQNKVSFSFEGTSIIAVLIEGRYPNYRSVIPTQNDKLVKINSASFKGSLSRTMVFSDHTSLVKLTLNFNVLCMAAKDIDFSTSADEEISCEYSGKHFQIGFNGNILQKIISLVDSDEVTVTLSDPNRAGLIYPSETKEGKVTFLIMPLLIN